VDEVEPNAKRFGCRYRQIDGPGACGAQIGRTKDARSSHARSIDQR
jgi:hypothetical protein